MSESGIVKATKLREFDEKGNPRETLRDKLSKGVGWVYLVLALGGIVYVWKPIWLPPDSFQTTLAIYAVVLFAWVPLMVVLWVVTGRNRLLAIVLPAIVFYVTVGMLNQVSITFDFRLGVVQGTVTKTEGCTTGEASGGGSELTCDLYDDLYRSTTTYTFSTYTFRQIDGLPLYRLVKRNLLRK